MLSINGKLARMLAAFGLAAAVAVVAGCGGGGGSGNSSAGTGSGGTGGTSNSTVLAAGAPVSSLPATLASNQVAVTVAAGVKNAPNIPTVSVTICAHGTTTCQTITDIQVDTGSWGLRLPLDALNGPMQSALPVETASGKSVAECFGFVDGNAWGSVRTADVTIGGETASSVPIHVMGDLPQTAAGGTNNSCATGSLNDTSSSIAAHGILGIGPAEYDCGNGCATPPNGVYFGCTGSGSSTNCTDLGVAETAQVTNPVRLFPIDNTGVILNMPAVTSSGSTSATGFLTFGIGTQSNNAVPTSGIQKLTTDHYGNVQSASLSGTSVSSAFFDTGSNGLFFPDSTLSSTMCKLAIGFYCPASTVSRTPSVTGFNGTNVSAGLSIANALDLFEDGGFAYGNVGGIMTGVAFDFGMPFFYGRTVYVNYDPNTDGNSGVATSAYVAF
ncbi:DUF3443 domain-containing protein [Paraburkholderia sp. CNPSo 3272]|uniref:DUF3443 family protein n=1 Tax=Paraburkholderia sp. CNPSo 3272 TaxID=2940931 RepID=UPI0020B68150|nr:DUF3443 family protein [Paraburkholderia sp. CNPSo 3272]MCP3723365.1 DUF3443 domain-containing protein [Paraburkholderia sp. CNPSo 3272]